MVEQILDSNVLDTGIVVALSSHFSFLFICLQLIRLLAAWFVSNYLQCEPIYFREYHLQKDVCVCWARKMRLCQMSVKSNSENVYMSVIIFIHIEHHKWVMLPCSHNDQVSFFSPILNYLCRTISISIQFCVNQTKPYIEACAYVCTYVCLSVVVHLFCLIVFTSSKSITHKRTKVYDKRRK